MDALPEEILCRILKEVEFEQSMEQLPLVNRKFARIVTPMLYYEVRLAYRCAPQQRTARRFLDTVVKYPHLRPLCRHLSIGEWQTIHKDANIVDNASISLYDLSNIIQNIPALASFPFEWQRKFVAELVHSVPDAMLAAILTLLPNVRRLSFQMNRHYCEHPDDIEMTDFTSLDFNTTLMMRLIGFSTIPSLKSFSLFSRLNRVAIIDDCEDDSPGWNTNLISSFLRLPTLKTFIGHGCRDMNEDSTWCCDSGASQVTSIDLSHCRLGAETIRKVLQSCKALEEFKLARVCKNCWGENEAYDYSYISTHHHLHRHTESLRFLRLQSQSCHHTSSRDEELVETLAMLENLQYLEIDEDALFGSHNECTRSLAELLPRTLQDLTIYGEETREQFDTIFEVRQTLLSNTNFSTVRFEDAYIVDVEKVLEKLPGVAFEEISERHNGFCDFRMYNVETR